MSSQSLKIRTCTLPATGKGKPARGSGLDKIRDVGPRAEALIESPQPYHRPAPRPGVIQSSALWALHELNRVDKHQELMVPNPIVKSLDVTTIHGVTILEHIAAVPLQDDAILVRWRSPRVPEIGTAISVHLLAGTKRTIVPSDKAFVEVHLQATCDVGFSEAGPTKGGLVLDSLNQISSRVRNPVEAFTQFFP